MKNYKIYNHPSGKVKIIKEGWSWSAFIFNIIWAFWRKLWLIGVASIIAIFIVAFLVELLSIYAGVSLENDLPNGVKSLDAILDIFCFFLAYKFGKNANSILRKDLLKKGYVQVDDVDASNEEMALAVYLNKQNQIQGINKF